LNEEDFHPNGMTEISQGSRSTATTTLGKTQKQIRTLKGVPEIREIGAIPKSLSPEAKGLTYASPVQRTG
jgi:hypothetical protein